MALQKEIELENGVTVVYHRIVSVNIVTNRQNIIETAGYTSRAKREEERSALESAEPMNIYISTRLYGADYDPSMTIETAYNYLKTLPDYDSAEDV